MARLWRRSLGPWRICFGVAPLTAPLSRDKLGTSGTLCDDVLVPPGIPHRSLAFDYAEARAALPKRPEEYATLEVPQSDGLLYRYLLLHVAASTSTWCAQSLRLTWSLPSAGLGWFCLREPDGEIWVLHQTVGTVAAGVGAPQLYHSIVLFAAEPDGASRLRSFCEHVLDAHKERTHPNSIAIHRFDHRSRCWQRLAIRPGRPWSSIVLPEHQLMQLKSDIAWFGDSATEARFADLGVPYRRVYLFSGSPGAGKTSTAAAIATATERPLCLLPFDSQLTEDAMLVALQKTPAKPLVVIEDVDLWLQRAESSTGTLTNALDGLATPPGAIFILTSNNSRPIEEAHHGALARPGRIDVHLRFRTADVSTARALFVRFFPDAEASALSVLDDLPEGASLALLQHLLLVCDREGLGPQQCAVKVANVLDEEKRRTLKP